MKNNYKKIQKKEVLSLLCPSTTAPCKDEIQLTFNFKTTDVKNCNKRIASRIQNLRKLRPEIDWISCILSCNILSENFHSYNTLNFVFCLCINSDENNISCRFDDFFHKQFNRYASLIDFTCSASKKKSLFDTRLDLNEWIIEFITTLSVVLSLTGNKLGNEQSYDIFEKLADFAWNNTHTNQTDAQFEQKQFTDIFIKKCQSIVDDDLKKELRDPKYFFELRCKNSNNFSTHKILSQLNQLDAGIYTILFLAKKPKTQHQRELVQTIFEKLRPKINTFIIYSEDKYRRNKKPLGLISHLIGEYRVELHGESHAKYM